MVWIKLIYEIEPNRLIIFTFRHNWVITGKKVWSMQISEPEISFAVFFAKWTTIMVSQNITFHQRKICAVKQLYIHRYFRNNTFHPRILNFMTQFQIKLGLRMSKFICEEIISCCKLYEASNLKIFNLIFFWKRRHTPVIMTWKV